MKLGTLLWVGLFVCSTFVLVYWNASRLIGAPAKPRMKDLEFVPSAHVLRLMSMGHTNTVAKLRWIDAFSYLQLQFEKKDDTLIGEVEEGGFDRLYDALIDLDPKFEAFYNFATTSASLIEGKNILALRCLQRGVLELPQSMRLWRSLAAEIKNMEGSNLYVLDGVLSAWARIAPDETQRYHIERWKSKLGIFELKGLKQLEYWSRQLTQYAQRSPLYHIALDTLRQQLNNYHVDVLQQLYDAGAGTGLQRCLSREAWIGVFASDGAIEVEQALVLWGPFQFPMDIANKMEASLKQREKRLRLTQVNCSLKNDVYGFPYQLQDNKIVSIGQQRFEFERKVTGYNNLIQNLVLEKKSWPRDLEEVWEWFSGQKLIAPEHGTLFWRDQQIIVEWSDADQFKAWDLKPLAVYWTALIDELKFNHQTQTK